jgi:uncharacterized protein YwgA
MRTELVQLIGDYYFSMFGEPVSVESFQKRLQFQKFVYTLAHFNIIPEAKPLFNWYIRGPYSSTIMDIAYELRSSDMSFESKPLPSELSFFNEIKNDSRKIELYASLLFLKDARYSKSEAKKLILIRKPDYSLEEIEEMISHIR